MDRCARLAREVENPSRYAGFDAILPTIGAGLMWILIQRLGFLTICFPLMLAEAIAQPQEAALPVPVAEVVVEEVQVPVKRAARPAPRAATRRTSPGQAQTSAEQTANKKPDESLEGLRKRFHEAQTEIALRKNQPAPKEPDDKQLIIVLENPHLSQGRYFGNNEYDRSFVVRMLIANPTARNYELKRTGVTLTSDQKTYKVPESLSNYHDSYSVGQNHFSISSLKMPEMVSIPAGKTASTWLVFGQLPMNPAVPDLKLTLEFGNEKREIDVNEFCHGLLKTRIERLGPKNCLAVLTIEGKLDPVNVKNLIDELDILAGEKHKLARAVICWGKDAEPVESNLMNWLQQSANEAGQIRAMQQNPNISYPIVPMSIRELHLAELPMDNGSGGNGQARIHAITADAVIAALRTAYQALPANDIVDDLRDPNPIIRSAALMGGGGQLPPDKLPVLLEFVNSEDRNLQRAAIFALRNFGEKAAIETLVELVKKNEQPRSGEAAESLATSRFAAASDALLELLKTAKPEVKTSIVEILAKHPRPIWGETIAEYARHPETPIGMAALRALNAIGHPELLSMLKNALKQSEASLQREAFDMLAGRKDQESEELAMEYTLKHLQTQPPQGEMTNLIQRTKDPRAIPLLMRHFQTKKGNRYSVISLLSQIGDQSVVDLLVAEYPKLDNNEKRAVLQGLQQLQSPEFVRLAAEALLSNDSSLMNIAADGLYREGTPQAEKALIDALKKDAKQSSWRYVCNALVNFATPAARDALREARLSKDTDKKNAAINALRSLQQRSPGNQYIYQARSYAQQNKWDLAIRYYNLCLESDSEYADAYAGRGNSYLNLNKLKEAKADFERAVKADPENSQGHAGIAIMKIMDGKIEEGVEYALSARKQYEQFENNRGMMMYNTACVYGRAVEKLAASPKDEKRDALLKDYQGKAVKELEDAIKNHFQDFNMMTNDPDLKSLAKLPEFQNLLPDGNKARDRKRPNLGFQEEALEEAAF